MIISISSKLASREKIKIGEPRNDDSVLHIDSFVGAGRQFIIVIERGSYYSHLFDMQDNETFKQVLDEVLPGPREYCPVRDASVRAKLNTVIKKAKFIIERIEERKSCPYGLEQASGILNHIPFKFLGFNAPSEIRKA